MSVIKTEGWERARERGKGGEVMKPLIGHALARLPSIDPVTPSPTSVKIMPHQSLAYIWHCGPALHFSSNAFSVCFHSSVDVFCVSLHLSVLVSVNKIVFVSSPVLWVKGLLCVLIEVSLGSGGPFIIRTAFIRCIVMHLIKRWNS